MSCSETATQRKLNRAQRWKIFSMPPLILSELQIAAENLNISKARRKAANGQLLPSKCFDISDNP